MEVTTNESRASIDPNVLDEAEGKIKKTFGQVRRKIKQIDLREQIIDNPFAAVGIGLAAGALIGLVRPKPRAGKVTSAFMTVAGAIAFRLIREAAVTQLGGFARTFLREQLGQHDDAGAASSGSSVRAPF